MQPGSSVQSPQIGGMTQADCSSFPAVVPSRQPWLPSTPGMTVPGEPDGKDGRGSEGYNKGRVWGENGGEGEGE